MAGWEDDGVPAPGAPFNFESPDSRPIKQHALSELPIMTKDVTNIARSAFTDRFGLAPTILVRAPGRVNLIGEHTDYNDGFVMPMAIDRWTAIALRPRMDDEVKLHSLETAETGSFSLADLSPGKVNGWLNYVHGVAGAMAAAGLALRGWEGVVASDVPVGAGLSSSASFELAVARAFAVLGDAPWDGAAMARLCQRAENEWAGVNCGIMDQLASACGVAGHALLIDCRSLEIRPAPLDARTKIIVLDTGKRRGLVDSAYNERRAQCVVAARACGASSLRDVTSEALEKVRADLGDAIFRRARHVLSENARTREAFETMARGDLATLGQLMNQSHLSLRDDFEVSCRELDAMVECAQAVKGCLGARMTGAGFGGCAVALVEAGAVEAFTTGVTAAYASATGLTPTAHVCRAVAGAEVLEGTR